MFNQLLPRIDRPDRRQVILFIFLLFWFIINMLQAAFTELAHDEAYYWMYSRNLAWGYYDHPPMIALLIRIGYSIFPNELGVRLLTTLMGTITLFILYILIDTKEKSLWLYILLVSSVLLIYSHVGGFLATPDIPLLFFSVLFIFLYRKYMDRDSYLLAILLGITSALMLYSKYHGILILVFTLLANLKIIRRLSFWVIPTLCGFLLLPHILWQLHNGCPSLEFHLLMRSSEYHLSHTLSYILGQFLIAGPLVSLIVFYQAFFGKNDSDFDKVLRFNLIGVFILFLLLSFKGRVEPHWTAIAYIPLIVLAYKACLVNHRARLWLQRLFIPSVLLFMLLRILLIFDVLPHKPKVLHELHNWDKWALQIDSLAQGRAVIFVNSYQRAAKYSFYTGGKTAYSHNNIFYRKNQYDIWPLEDSLQGKPVLFLFSIPPGDTLNTVTGESYPYMFVDDFHSYSNLVIKTDRTKLEVYEGDTIDLDIFLENPRSRRVEFMKGDIITAYLFSGKEYASCTKVYQLDQIKLDPGEDRSLHLRIPVTAMSGKYRMFISIRTDKLHPSFNAKPLELLIL